jgi:ComF family protein
MKAPSLFVERLPVPVCKRLISQTLDFLYPPVCQICARSISAEMEGSPGVALANRYLCPTCDLPEKSPLIASDETRGKNEWDLSICTCSRCGETGFDSSLTNQIVSIVKPEQKSELVRDACQISYTACLSCLLFPPPFRYLRSAFTYDKRIELVIKAFKYRGHFALYHRLSHVLAQTIIGLAESLQAKPEELWDLIIPVPSSTTTLRSRGFNHMGIVSKKVSRLVDIPISLRALCSLGTRKAQAGLSLSERVSNLDGAFRAQISLVQEKNILLLDDIITSGETLWAAASELKACGAAEIDSVTLARSQRFKRNRLVSNRIREDNIAPQKNICCYR